MVSSSEMIANTTSSSTSVNPLLRFMASPLFEGDAVQSHDGGAGADVEYVLAFGRIVRRRGVGANRPAATGGAAGEAVAVGRCERIARYAAQEVHVLLARAALVRHAGDQVLQLFRIAGFAHRQLDAAVVGGALVGVDGFADLDQRGAQLVFFFAL